MRVQWPMCIATAWQREIELAVAISPNAGCETAVSNQPRRRRSRMPQLRANRSFRPRSKLPSQRKDVRTLPETRTLRLQMPVKGTKPTETTATAQRLSRSSSKPPAPSRQSKVRGPWLAHRCPRICRWRRLRFRYRSRAQQHCQQLPRQRACAGHAEWRRNQCTDRLRCIVQLAGRDRGWFFKPQRFATKLTLLQKETLQLSNATNFSSIRQETTKLQEFKVERFANKFVTVTTGKDPVRRHKRLDFPPWQRFICIYTGITGHHITGACMAVRIRRFNLLLFALQFSQALALFFGLFRQNTKEPMHWKITTGMISFNFCNGRTFTGSGATAAHPHPHSG